jgi:hypothetical protein
MKIERQGKESGEARLRVQKNPRVTYILYIFYTFTVGAQYNPSIREEIKQGVEPLCRRR